RQSRSCSAFCLLPSAFCLLAPDVYDFLTRLLQPHLVLWLVAALALASLWRKRREAPGRLLLVTVPFALLTARPTPAVNWLAMRSLESPFPPLEARPADAGAIVVLSGAVQFHDDEGKRFDLAEDTMARCVKAAELYHEGPRCPVVVSGGKVHADAPG